MEKVNCCWQFTFDQSWCFKESIPDSLRIGDNNRSRSSDYDALDSYHRDDTESDTAAVHNKQKDDIQRDPNRQAIYWRIVTPESMPLDNVILSGDSTQIVKNEKGVKRTAGENIVVLSYFVNWVIAKQKVGHQISSAKKTLLADAFA